MKKRILILGTTSNIGNRFIEINQNNRNMDIYGVCRREFPTSKVKKMYLFSDIDICGIKKLIDDIKPNIILNCISIGDVDYCEREKEFSKKVNVDFALELLNICNHESIKLIAFSSSLVYDGKDNLYDESSKMNPLNEYASQKVLFDNVIRKYLHQHILIRPTTLIGIKKHYQRSNPAIFILDKLLKNEKLVLVDDVVTNFLYLDDLIQIITLFIQNNILGEYNLGGIDAMSRYELGLKIQSYVHDNKSIINSCESSYFKSIATRPLKTILSNEKLLKVIKFKFSSIDKIISEIINSYHE